MDGGLGGGLFFAMWAGVTAAQAFGVFSAVGADNLAAAAVIALLTQLAKVPMTAARLRALNRPPDDAILALVPFANLGLLNQLLTARPLPPIDGPPEISAVEAWRHGVRATLRAAPIVIVVAIVWGFVYSGVTEAGVRLFNHYLSLPQDQVASWLFNGRAIAGALGLWTVATFVRRDRARPLDWLPAALFVPALLFVLGMSGKDRGFGPALVTVPLTAMGLAVGSTVGAYLSALWVRIAEAVAADEAPTARLGTLGSDGLRILGPHAAATHATQIGMQLVIPGIYYMVALALVDVIAIVDPSATPLSRSMRLTAGIRRRVFKLVVLGALVYVVLSAPLALMFYDPASLYGALLLPTAIDWKVWAILDAVGAFAFAPVTMGSLWLYRERAARVA